MEDYRIDQYQWVAQITKELVYPDPENRPARLLCVGALEQLGYRAESGTWGNAYLCAAMELRNGNQSAVAKGVTGMDSVMAELSTEMLVDYLAISTDTLKAQHDGLSMNLYILDTGERFCVRRKHGMLPC